MFPGRAIEAKTKKDKEKQNRAAEPDLFQLVDFFVAGACAHTRSLQGRPWWQREGFRPRSTRPQPADALSPWPLAGRAKRSLPGRGFIYLPRHAARAVQARFGRAQGLLARADHSTPSSGFLC